MASQFPPQRRALRVVMCTQDPSEVERVRSGFERYLLPVDVRHTRPESLFDLGNKGCSCPDLVLLSLSDPEAVETLKTLKGSPEMGSIPIALVLSSCKECSLDAFPLKPTSFDQLVGHLRSLHPHWFGIVEPPREETIPMPRMAFGSRAKPSLPLHHASL